MERVKPNVPLGTFGIYEGILCNFPNFKLLFIRLRGLKYYFALRRLDKTRL